MRVVIALIASLVAFLVGAIMLGAYIPAIPKAGVIGPVLGGQYPFHVAVIALVGVALAVSAWRSGLARWGGVLTAVTALSTVGALAIGGIQFAAAERAGVDVSFGQVFSEPSYPDSEPDSTTVYASPDGRPLEADLYLPKKGSGRAAGKAPAIVLAHSGGFHTFDKSDLRGTGRWLADHGVAVVAVDYRLATPGHPTWDKAPQDLVSALGWVQRNADRYGIDPARVSLGGTSAGGTLAMNAAYRLQAGTISPSSGAAPAPPALVVGFYPGTDVTRMWEDDVAGTREAAELFTGGTPEQHPERYREVSPTTGIRAGLPRTLLVVGDRDRSARPETVTDFGDALRAKGVDTVVKKLPFAEHAFDDAYGSLTSQTSRRILLDFLTGDSR
ncbi:alpha/beta hydrolase [Streptomyces sp. NBC_01565]|uniref:alpha/beta hydrolase n=1 Tax=unclassified Streptomyces TaxID=2593676 RepID=UPI00225260FC|nr:alpha/beta hydrolase [Streptomyces sp. NBC_01565]MCX4539460.1 alpha/beta hydrolase [Streptomyces sp. NBC_01565]